MDTYFGSLNVDLLRYIIKKMLIYIETKSVFNLASSNKNIETILSDDIIYLQVLDNIREHPEIKFSYNRFKDRIKNNWIDKYLLFSILIKSIAYVDIAVNLLTNGSTTYTTPLSVTYTRSPVSLDYLDVPGIDYRDIQVRLLKCKMGNISSYTVLHEKKLDKYMVRLGLCDRTSPYNFSCDFYLNESQLRNLLIGILYLNIEITDVEGEGIF